MSINMRKIMATVALVFSLPYAYATDTVKFQFIDGIEDGNLKILMENQINSLFAAINQAEVLNSDINYSGIEIDGMASQSIGMLWNNVHFRIDSELIREHCLTTRNSKGLINGYQVRNIPLRMTPIDDSYTDELEQEACINFNKQGTITDFNITMGTQQYQSLMKKGVELNDFDMRMQIIHYVEQFRTAYNQKDIKFMENVFSDDAIIITGKEVLRKKNSDFNVGFTKDVVYTTQSKAQYLANLRRIFARNGYVNVKFSNISIKRSGSNKNFYGVTVVQDWHTKSYSDQGIVFMLWDFTNPDMPQIHVRTWQPNGVDHVFTLHDFTLPDN